MFLLGRGLYGVCRWGREKRHGIGAVVVRAADVVCGLFHSDGNDPDLSAMGAIPVFLEIRDELDNFDGIPADVAFLHVVATGVREL